MSVALRLVVAMFLASYLFPAAYWICHPDDYSHAKVCGQYHLGPAVIAWLFANADIHNGLVTAFATLAIACLTVSLRNSSNKLAGISLDQTTIAKAQAKLAQAQHLAEHRPRLKVRHVSLGTRESPMTQLPGVGERLRGGLVVVNVGSTRAKIIDSRYLIYCAQSRDRLPMMSPMDERWEALLVPDDIGIGQSIAVPITGTVEVKQAPGTFLPLGLQQWTVYVMGQIQYQDEGRNDRFMGFCRRWYGEGTFEAVLDPDYEYED